MYICCRPVIFSPSAHDFARESSAVQISVWAASTRQTLDQAVRVVELSWRVVLVSIPCSTHGTSTFIRSNLKLPTTHVSVNLTLVIFFNCITKNCVSPGQSDPELTSVFPTAMKSALEYSIHMISPYDSNPQTYKVAKLRRYLHAAGRAQVPLSSCSCIHVGPQSIIAVLRGNVRVPGTRLS